MGIQAFNELLSQRIRELIPVQTAYAICKEVNWEEKTMIATGQTDNLDYYEVDLGKGSELKKPKPGTLCLIGIIENSAANAFLIEAQELEELQIKTATTQLIVKEEGIKIQRDNEDLLSVLSDMIDEINKIKVIYGNTVNVMEMTAIKQRLNGILISD